MSVCEYSKEHWGIDQADLYIDTFMLQFVWLTRNRNLWRPRTDLTEGIFSCIEKSQVIFFSENQGRIDIFRVLHGRMDLGQHLE